MAIRENGRTTKKMGMDHIYTPTVKDMRVAGTKTRNKAMEPINTRMEISTMESGKMIIATATERCNTAIMLPIRANGRRENSTGEVFLPLSKVIVIMESG